MDTVLTLELAPITDRVSTPVEIFRATDQDIDGLARVQWLARKNGVAQGYLPERVLGLHAGEKLEDVSDDLGIRYAKGELTRTYMKSSRLPNTFLAAKINNEIVGKGGIYIDSDSKVAEFDQLEVLPEFQGKGIATKLRHDSVQYVKKNYPSVKYIRLGRYNSSIEHAHANYSSDSFFNVLMEKASMKEDETIDENISITWLKIPLDTYQQEVEKRLVKVHR